LAAAEDERVNEKVSSFSEGASEGFPSAKAATALKLDPARARTEIEEARRLYDVAALVHERSGLGSIDSAPIAHKSLLVLMRLITRAYGVEPQNEAELILQTQQVNEKESFVGYDLTEDLKIIARAKEQFFDLDSQSDRADGRRYDRAFIRFAKVLSAVKQHLDDVSPGAHSSALRHWKYALVGVLALGVGFLLGGSGKRAQPALPPVVVSASERAAVAPRTEDGAASGQLEATFFKDPELTQAAFSRQDSALDFNWASGEPPELGQNDNFSVRWVGKLNIVERGSYDFYLTSDDGSRLFIGDSLVVDNWGVHALESKQGSVELEAGTHPFRLEYFDGTGDAVVKLEWSSSSQPRRVLSSSDLR
jgi:hypothetical protein